MEKWEKNTYSRQFSVTCTGTPWTCTGTCAPEPNLYRYMSNLYRYTLLYFDQFLYVSHKLLISYPIGVIQVAN